VIIDKFTEFADASALDTNGTGRVLIGDVVDMSAASMSAGDDLYLVVQVDTAVTSTGGAATVSFELVSDAQEAIATDGTATPHVFSAAIPEATLVAGYMAFAVQLPPGNYERYLGVLQNVGAEALTGGKVNAFLTHDVSKWAAFADAVS
jgi:hypothetical protein